MRFQRRQMRPTPAASARPAVTLPSIPYRRAVVLLGLLALCGGHALAQDDDFQARANAAIERGVAHLKQRQSPDGSWQGPHTLGMTSLCAWTLLEAGVPKTDPALEKAISLVRNGCLNLDYVYAVATTIFFLDRLGDPADVPLIEALSAQLLGSVTQFHGWTYGCVTLTKEDQDAVRERVQKIKEKLASQEPDKEPEKQADKAGHVQGGKRKASAEALQLLSKIRAKGRVSLPGDNSNTQFAMMAVWVARRHGMPVEDVLLGVESRFRRYQQQNGGWGYQISVLDPKSGDQEFRATPTFTCAGLLAFALGKGVKKDAKAADLLKDPGVKAGLAALSKYMDGDPRGGKGYCFLWSLERMGVVYGLKKVGDRDWYRWGADHLLSENTGTWGGTYGFADTCFAILFLKRANVAEDLTRQLNLFNPIIKVPPPKR